MILGSTKKHKNKEVHMSIIDSIGMAHAYLTLSSFSRVNPVKSEIEQHKYVSVNGGIPQHTVTYKTYNRFGEIEESPPVGEKVNINVK